VCEQDMDADTLRDAINKEMADYRRPKLLSSQTSYILRPVIAADDSLPSHHSGDQCQLATNSTVSNTLSQSESSACCQLTPATDIVSDISSADVTVKFQVPGISTVKVEVDGNSVEMPSATTCRQPDDVTMLSARSVSDSDTKLKEEIYQGTSVNRSTAADTTDNQTNSAVITDNWTDTNAPVIIDTRSDSNTLVVNTELPQAADAKARIKAALLNSGRRRQRLGMFAARN